MDHYSHLEKTDISSQISSVSDGYRRDRTRKWLLLSAFLIILFGVAVFAVFLGQYQTSLSEVLRALFGKSAGTADIVVTKIRVPRVCAAIVTGWGISLSGLCIQSLLKNPLGSPSTLGISQGAAFGAACAVVFIGMKVFSITFFAFGGALLGTLTILILARLKRLSPEAIILAGVALSSLFGSAIIVVQYLATEIELAAVVFWSFGDVARSNWSEIVLLAAAAVLFFIFLSFRRWDLNALVCGEDTAKSLGVNVEKLRVVGMLAAALVAAMATAFHGVIAFVGLVAPHMARRLIGDDHRLLIPFSALMGALLLLTADTAGRLLIGSGALPVGVATSFLGAPMFIYLLIREYQ
jgi:iron complex transport system permease protein